MSKEQQLSEQGYHHRHGRPMVLNLIFRLLQINLTSWNGSQCHIILSGLPRLDLDSPTVICGETFNTWVVTQIQGL